CGAADLFRHAGVGWRQASRHPRFPPCPLRDRGRRHQEVIIRKLIVSTLVTLDRAVQDLGGFGETAQGGSASPDFTEEAAGGSYENPMTSDHFLYGRVTCELLSPWGGQREVERRRVHEDLKSFSNPLRPGERLIGSGAVATTQSLGEHRCS